MLVCLYAQLSVCVGMLLYVNMSSFTTIINYENGSCTMSYVMVHHIILHTVILSPTHMHDIVAVH